CPRAEAGARKGAKRREAPVVLHDGRRRPRRDGVAGVPDSPALSQDQKHVSALPRDQLSELRAAATAAWPRLIPPSFAGTCRCVSTRSPTSSSRRTTPVTSSTFWNTPPDSATLRTPDSSLS